MSKIINSIRKHFAQHPNAIITDTNLSDGSVRVFLYMCGKPDDWQFNNRDIQLRLNIKRAETIAKYWKELIESGWISREPKLNLNGKPSGYFDYVLNFSPVKPTPQKPEVGTTNKPDPVNQQLRKNSSYTNTESITNKENNPPMPVNKSGENWLLIAQKNNLTFDEEEQAFISKWLKYLSTKQQSIDDIQLEVILARFDKLCTDGYDICSMITDTMEAKFKWLIKPTTAHKKANVSSKPNKIKLLNRPYKYNNPKYFIPESPEEKRKLADYLKVCYNNKINPKTDQLMSKNEEDLIKLHQKIFSSQAKNESGRFLNYVSWLDYILQNEVYTSISLLDQPINDLMLTNISHQSSLHSGDAL